MTPYHSKFGKLPGTDYREAYKSALDYFSQIKAKTKRQPYVRSAYFQKNKVFLNLFWQHLFQKPQAVRKSRLKLFADAIDLIAHSRNQPTQKPNPNQPRETLYRFAGLTKNKEIFFVQIKQSPNGKKYFMSVFEP